MMDKEIKSRFLIFLILFPTALKLIIGFIIPGHMAIDNAASHGDIDVFKDVTNALLSGQNPNTLGESIYQPVYGPMFYLLFLINGVIAVNTGIPFHFVVKILPIIAETITSVVIFLILTKKYSQKSSFYWSLLFALNPASLSISSIHGQFDAIPILTIALSYYFFKNHAETRSILPAICLGIGASFKYFFPLLIAGVLFFKCRGIKEKIVFALSTILTLLVTYIPLMISGDFFSLIKNQLLFNTYLNWGIGKFFLLVHYMNISIQPIVFIENLITSYGKFFLLAALIATLFISSKIKSVKRSYEILFYCFYAFSFFINPQYLIWIVPLLFLEINPRKLFYLVPSTIHLYFLYIINLIAIGLNIKLPFVSFFPIISFIFGVITWLYCVYAYFTKISKHNSRGESRGKI